MRLSSDPVGEWNGGDDTAEGSIYCLSFFSFLSLFPSSFRSSGLDYLLLHSILSVAFNFFLLMEKKGSDLYRLLFLRNF